MTLKKVKLTSEEIKKLDFQNAMMTEALYEAYEDYDNMYSVLRYIIDDIEKENFSKYQIRNALKALRTLMIKNQCDMMDMAGLEY